jgi:hypothetical protein
MRKQVLLLIMLPILALSACSLGKINHVTEFDELVTIAWTRVSAKKNLQCSEPIPEEFDSYTFFLFPDDRWIRKNNGETLEELYDAFVGFGNAIGERNLAIWFSCHEKLDTQRSADFVHIFDLNVNSGPYVLYIEPKHPIVKHIICEYSGDFRKKRMRKSELMALKDQELSDKFVIDLNELGLNCTIDLLNLLRMRLRHDLSNKTVPVELKSSNCSKGKYRLYVESANQSGYLEGLINRLTSFKVWATCKQIQIGFEVTFFEPRQSVAPVIERSIPQISEK